MPENGDGKLEGENLLRAWLRGSGAPVELEQYLDLNLNPIAHMHARFWPEPLGDDWASLVISKPRAATFLNRCLFKQWGWDEWVANDLDEHVQKLLLLPPSDWEALQIKAGSLCLSGLIQRTIDRQTLARLREDFGDAILQFARYSAPSFRPKVPEDFVQTSWAENTKIQVLEAGANLISGAFANQPDGVKRRLQRKLASDLLPVPGSGDPAILMKIIVRLSGQQPTEK